MTPPAAPEPTMTKSTVSESRYVRALIVDFTGSIDEAGIVAVVVAERRLKDVLVFEADAASSRRRRDCRRTPGIENMPSSVSSRVVSKNGVLIDRLQILDLLLGWRATRTMRRRDDCSRNAA